MARCSSNTASKHRFNSRRNARSLAFRNYFISADDAELHDRVVAIAQPDAYVERLDHGTYVSMSAEFNPGRRAVPYVDATERSTEVGRLLAATSGRH